MTHVHDFAFPNIEDHPPFVRPGAQVVQSILQVLPVLLHSHCLSQLGVVSESLQDVDLPDHPSMLLLKMKNSSGPSTLPCGTPDNTFWKVKNQNPSSSLRATES